MKTKISFYQAKKLEDLTDTKSTEELNNLTT